MEVHPFDLHGVLLNETVGLVNLQARSIPALDRKTHSMDRHRHDLRVKTTSMEFWLMVEWKVGLEQAERVESEVVLICEGNNREKRVRHAVLGYEDEKF